MPDGLLPTLIQFPLLGIFVWFTFEMQKRYQSSVDACRRHEAEERAKRDEQWRAFLLDQRQAQAAGLEALGARMEQMAGVLAAISANVNQVMVKFGQHDARAEEIFKALAAHDAATVRRF